jgi:hypothetical protein
MAMSPIKRAHAKVCAAHEDQTIKPYRKPYKETMMRRVMSRAELRVFDTECVATRHEAVRRRQHRASDSRFKAAHMKPAWNMQLASLRKSPAMYRTMRNSLPAFEGAHDAIR